MPRLPQSLVPNLTRCGPSLTARVCWALCCRRRRARHKEGTIELLCERRWEGCSESPGVCDKKDVKMIVGCLVTFRPPAQWHAVGCQPRPKLFDFGATSADIGPQIWSTMVADRTRLNWAEVGCQISGVDSGPSLVEFGRIRQTNLVRIRATWTIYGLSLANLGPEWAKFGLPARERDPHGTRVGSEWRGADPTRRRAAHSDHCDDIGCLRGSTLEGVCGGQLLRVSSGAVRAKLSKREHTAHSPRPVWLPKTML